MENSYDGYLSATASCIGSMSLISSVGLRFEDSEGKATLVKIPLKEQIKCEYCGRTYKKDETGDGTCKSCGAILLV